ncbi:MULTISPECIES: hypothetical protein [Kitasatospora]|uniref:DUF4232 domain-containing protein n=1 Tax=Kitasatospora cathayae TaxID=3004092 RepID=A0ABY7Q510_9ACTN|nr:hypothetical protein [Kitasatospora sp. HUAS 3-15]WBP87797.1 hypothetical protein O1G21_19400 [Kitasatospora sp. HUAS 3-15]
MNSRTALLAVAAAAVALTLSACGPGNDPTPDPTATKAAPTASATAASVPTAAPTGSGTAKPKPTKTAKPSGAPNPGQAGADCKPGEMKPIPAGHKVIVLSKPTTTTTVVAKDGEYTCHMPDQGWWPVGEDKTYTFAPGAKATLTTIDGQKSITLERLVDHSTHCVNHINDPASNCDEGTDYDIVLDASGKITAITELYNDAP